MVFRYRVKLTKTGTLKYFSHLDWQNTFFKAISRTNLNVAFSMGYNPSMKISMGVADLNITNPVYYEPPVEINKDSWTKIEFTYTLKTEKED